MHRADSRRRALLVAALAALVLASFAIRTARPLYTESEAGVFFWDNDTVRRLVRLRALEDAETYPFRNPLDGWPEGTVIHWTRPMDWVITALDAVVPAIHADARAYESGAAYAGPVLGALATLAFALLAMRWLGTARGLLAAGLYALAVPVYEMTRVGNGDHASLHHLALVVAVLGFGCVVAGRAGPLLAAVTGAALGLALWVSTETMAVLVALAAATAAALVACGEGGERRAALRRHAVWVAACLAVCVLADRVEHPGSLPTFRWDEVSGFQVWQLIVLGGFLALCALLDRRMGGRWTPPVAAAGIAFVAGVLPFAVVGPLRAALDAQWESLQAANRWTQTCVREYFPLLTDPLAGTFSTAFAQDAFTWILYLLPLLAVGVALAREQRPAARTALLVLAAGAFALTCLEIKFAHLFVVLWVPLIVVGGTALLRRGAETALGPATVSWVLGAGAAAAIVVFAGAVHSFSADQRAREGEQAMRAHLTAALADLPESPPGNGLPPRNGVLAQWEVGAHVMYYGGKPAVASGYHRNLEGIRDSYRLLTTGSRAEARALLAERRVRWVVRQGDPQLFFQIPSAFPSLGSFGALEPVVRGGRTGFRVRLGPRARRSMWWRLNGPVPAQSGFRLVYRSPAEVDWFGQLTAPVFQVYEVLDEDRR